MQNLSGGTLFKCYPGPFSSVSYNHSTFGRSRVALKTFETENEARNFFKYATSEIIRFAFLMTDESLTSLAKKVPDLLDYTDNNGLIDYNGDVNGQLYKLFGIDDAQQQYIKEVLSRGCKLNCVSKE